MTPYTLFRLLPRFSVVWYADKLRVRLVWVEEQTVWANRLLEDVAPNYEYTAGFRAHLERKLTEWGQERLDLVSKISIVEEWLEG